MTEKMKLIVNVSKFKKSKRKRRNDNVYKILDKLVKEVKGESIYSATFSLAVDSLETKSNVFSIKNGRNKKEKIFTEFKA